jgi:hypothetical protein
MSFCTEKQVSFFFLFHRLCFKRQKNKRIRDCMHVIITGGFAYVRSSGKYRRTGTFSMYIKDRKEQRKHRS